MLEDEKIKLYKDLAEFKGRDYQRYKLIEELGELIQAKVKFTQHENSENLKNLVSEIADVSILMEQLIFNYNINPAILNERSKKIDSQGIEEYIIYSASKLIIDLVLFDNRVDLTLTCLMFALDTFLEEKSCLDAFNKEKHSKLQRTIKLLYSSDKEKL